jgi:lysophospholipase L1-like esterase
MTLLSAAHLVVQAQWVLVTLAVLLVGGAPRGESGASNQADEHVAVLQASVPQDDPPPLDVKFPPSRLGDIRGGASQWRIMPLGDSISICCNYCAVPAGVLVRKELHEPPTPWDGYIRKLWLRLKAEEQRQASIPVPPSHRFAFSYVGRVVTCMVNRSETMRVADDWEIRYEGYYGYTTGRVLGEIVAPALQANDPDIVLLMLGTNDLIQAKAGNRMGRVIGAIHNLKLLLEVLLTTPRSDPEVQGRSRHVLIGKIPPIWFGQIKAVPPSGRKPHRVAALNREIEKLVASLVDAQRERYVQLHGRADGFLATVRTVDMFSNFSVTQDLHGDGLHPNALGEDKMSARWYNGLVPILNDPAAYHAVTMGQNDDRLMRQSLGQTLPAGTAGRNTNKGRDVVLQDSILFGERASSGWDRALLPAIVFTIAAYAFLVCRPSQRLARQMYAMLLASWNRFVLGKSKPAPQ